jgi:hypothetical protein
MPHLGTATRTISELREFAAFLAAEQRYITRSLDIGLARQDAMALWARDGEETASILAQHAAYQELSSFRALLPQASAGACSDSFIGKLIAISAFDLAQGGLSCFSAYRFLYERLLGPAVRPWLPAAFCAAAALPQIHPVRRKTLLQSISEAAATAPAWSASAPGFFPEWIDTAPDFDRAPE